VPSGGGGGGGAAAAAGGAAAAAEEAPAEEEKEEEKEESDEDVIPATVKCLILDGFRLVRLECWSLCPYYGYLIVTTLFPTTGPMRICFTSYSAQF